jgi:hypothetical protein
VPLLRFDGWIAGFGTSCGLRVVLGHWPESPFGPVSDLMIEDVDGQRTLLASDPALAEFVTGTYTFDAVAVLPVGVERWGTSWGLDAGDLRCAFTVGPRAPLGRLLRAVPAALSRQPRWVQAVDLPARLVLPGVRTHGSAGNGRHEWYGARDLHPVTAVAGTYRGRSLGELAAVDPPVRFGFGSTPRDPSLVRITTTVSA